jgi:alkylated DNA repair dioxygenase AlkB
MSHRRRAGNPKLGGLALCLPAGLAIRARERRELVTECRYCGCEVILCSGADRTEWRHLPTADIRCSMGAETDEEVA